MGKEDRIVRVMVAIAVAALYFTGVISGMVATILLAVAGVFIVTSLAGFCPLYLPLGLNTIRKKLTK